MPEKLQFRHTIITPHYLVHFFQEWRKLIEFLLGHQRPGKRKAKRQEVPHLTLKRCLPVDRNGHRRQGKCWDKAGGLGPTLQRQKDDAQLAGALCLQRHDCQGHTDSYTLSDGIQI